MADKWITNAAIGREFTLGAQKSEHSAAQIMAGANATAMCAFALADIRNLLALFLAAMEKADTARCTDALEQRCKWNDLVKQTMEKITEVSGNKASGDATPAPRVEMDPMPVGVLKMAEQYRKDCNDLIDFNRVPEHLVRTLKKKGIYRRHQITEELGNSLKPLAKKQFFNTFLLYPTR